MIRNSPSPSQVLLEWYCNNFFYQLLIALSYPSHPFKAYYLHLHESDTHGSESNYLTWFLASLSFFLMEWYQFGNFLNSLLLWARVMDMFSNCIIPYTESLTSHENCAPKYTSRLGLLHEDSYYANSYELLNSINYYSFSDRDLQLLE